MEQANRLLAKAMDPETSGLHPGLFDDSLLGIGFYTVLEAGLFVSGNVGTGIVMARNPTNGDWSPPAAVGLSGMGWGLMGGANMKSLVYLIYDYFTIEALSGEGTVMIGSQAGASLGAWGRTAETSAIMSNKGVGKNLALACSRGMFVGLSIEGAFSKGRNRVNEKFYGRRVTTAEILFSGAAAAGPGGGTFDVPDGTLLPEVHDKLRRLCGGTPVYEPTQEEKTKVELALREVANQEEDEAEEEEAAAIHGNKSDSSLPAELPPPPPRKFGRRPTTHECDTETEKQQQQTHDTAADEEEAIECCLDNLRAGAKKLTSSVRSISTSSQKREATTAEALADQ